MISTRPTIACCAILVAFLLVPTLATAQSFAYVANSGTPSSISGYAVNPTTGALTPVPGSPFASGRDTNSIVVHPNGHFLYATNENDNNVVAFTIDPATGSLTPIAGSPFPSGANPNSITIHPNGQFLYTANEGDQTISIYSIGPSGALTQTAASPFTVAGATGRTDSIALDPSGRFAYVTESSISPGNLYAFTVNPSTGALTPVVGSPYATGNDTGWVAVNPSGRFVYAADFISQTVTAFSINQTSGALTPITGSPFPVGGNPDQVTVDPSGRFVYAANDGAVGPSGAGVLAVDPNTGALTPALGSPFAAGKSPSGVTPNANTGFLYVANENSNNVSVFSINPATGVLTEIAGSPFAAGSEPVKIALTPRPIDAVQVNYAANLNIGDAFVNITNSGASGSNLCVNVYTFDPAEELISCCACSVTANALQSLSVLKSLISNPLTPAIPTAVSIKLAATVAGPRNACDPSTVTLANLAPGMLAWGTSLHAATTTPPSYAATEKAFSLTPFSAADLSHIASTCAFIESNGSGFGICKGCAAGGLGATPAQ